MEFQTFNKFILLLLFLQNCVSKSDDLYNTKAATTDLDWTPYPAQNGWEELSNRDLDGKIIRSYQVCNLGHQATSSWVRTPYIPSKDAKRAYIDVEFSMRKCDDCKETFNLYYFEADTDEASSTYPPWRENPYVKIDTIAAAERFDSSDANIADGVNFKTWTLGPLTRNGFYIAAHDQGACMSILSLRVYYYYCPETIDGLAVFSRTATGNETTSLQEVIGKCIPNASPITNEPRYYCNSNGVWKVRTGSCHCNPGFEANQLLIECSVCTDDSYKDSHGNHKCVKCPEHSTIAGGAEFCECFPGYFRNPHETVRSACTKPPSAPTQVHSSINVTSVQLSWQPPTKDGGRKDLYYNVTCEKCYRKQSSSGLDVCMPCSHGVTFNPSNHNQIRGTSCSIKNLQPYTNYKFQIFARNGVTSMSPLAPARRTVFATTREGVPSQVDSVHVLSTHFDGVSLSWSQPTRPNGRIVKYEVRWTDQTVGKQENSIAFGSPQILETNNTLATISGLTPGHFYSFQIRAATVVGYGPYNSQIDVRATSNGVSGPKQSSTQSAIQIGIITGIFSFLVLLFGGLFFYCKKRKTWIGKRITNDTDSEETIALHSNGEIAQHSPQNSSNDTRSYIDYPDPFLAVQEFSCEIDPNQLKIEERIGQGEFGEVWRGKFFESTGGGVVDVAVKRLKEGSSEHANFLREASAMVQFSHPNIIQLKGVVTKSVPFMIVTEYMENGSLDAFLKKKKDQLSLCQLVKMLQGIASGMCYLSNIKYIHRDLAARNILVDQDLNCKVGDFGLSRTLDNPQAIYTTHGGKIAIRWTAPECIRYREFTSASDVWSFGVVMWEVTSYGEKPYWDMSNQKVMESIDEGFRLPSPDGCSVSLHRLMVKCWAFEAEMRPTMDDVHRRLGELLRNPNLLNRTSHAKHQSPSDQKINSPTQGS